MLEKTRQAATWAVFLSFFCFILGLLVSEFVSVWHRQNLYTSSSSAPPFVSFLWCFPLCPKFSFLLSALQCSPPSEQFMAQELLIQTTLLVDIELGLSSALIFSEGPQAGRDRGHSLLPGAFFSLTFRCLNSLLDLGKSPEK